MWLCIPRSRRTQPHHLTPPALGNLKVVNLAERWIAPREAHQLNSVRRETFQQNTRHKNSYFITTPLAPLAEREPQQHHHQLRRRRDLAYTCLSQGRLFHAKRQPEHADLPIFLGSGRSRFLGKHSIHLATPANALTRFSQPKLAVDVTPAHNPATETRPNRQPLSAAAASFSRPRPRCSLCCLSPLLAKDVVFSFAWRLL